MPQMPGLLAMPTVVLNATLSTLPDRSRVVRAPDRIAVVSPMFDEELGAAAAVASILAQRHPADQVFISINGGQDRTPEVVAEALARSAYLQTDGRHDFELGASIDRWSSQGGPDVVVLRYSAQVSKAASVNRLLASGMVDAERVLLVDGDTVLDPGFIGALRDHFYRLRRERHAGGWRYVIEDVALQSGVVFSRPPQRAGAQAALISAARSAEYAFSTVVRLGQTRKLGRGATFGASRLYTAVGCGFSSRSTAFPIPTDTQTEDHDLSLRAQGDGVAERMVSVEGLHLRGFKVVVGGEEVSTIDFFRDQDEVLLRRTSDARLVPQARMYTDDPLRLTGYVRQVERWTGGGIENALKRVFNPASWGSLLPNVRFAVLSAQLENLLGLLLLLALPVLAGLNVARPDWGLSASGWRWWLLADLLATGTLVLMGYLRLERARGSPWPAVWRRAIRATIGTMPALILLRPVNAVCYITAASRAISAHRERRREERRELDVTWQRPRSLVRQQVPVRTAGVAATMLLSGILVFTTVVGVASLLRPAEREVYRMIYASPRVETSDHVVLPVAWKPVDEAPVPGYSSYCRPGYVQGTGDVVRSLADGAPAYSPLNPWGLIILARLVPILVHLEEAASAYDISPEFLLKVLINESYLDPLAEGQTGDLGMSQVTGDALTLLRSLAYDRNSPYANEHFFATGFSVFDPDFSICAGAAKLAWAGSQAGGEDELVAYARYINPFDGVVRGAVSERHQPLVESMAALGSTAGLLSATVAAFRADPELVSPEERALLEVSERLRAGAIGLPEAYAQSADLVRSFELNDRDFYRLVLERLYPADEMLAQSPLS